MLARAALAQARAQNPELAALQAPDSVVLVAAAASAALAQAEDLGGAAEAQQGAPELVEIVQEVAIYLVVSSANAPFSLQLRPGQARAQALLRPSLCGRGQSGLPDLGKRVGPSVNPPDAPLQQWASRGGAGSPASG